MTRQKNKRGDGMRESNDNPVIPNGAGRGGGRGESVITGLPSVKYTADNTESIPLHISSFFFFFNSSGE